MKNYLMKALFGLMFLGLLFTSCEDDGTGGGPGTGSDLILNVTGASDVTALAGDTIYVNLSAEEGDSPLNSITVKENDVNLPLERVLYDGVATANPLLLSGLDKVAYSTTMGIVVSDQPGVYVYSIAVADETGAGKIANVTVTIEDIPEPAEINTLPMGTFESLTATVSVKLTITAGSRDLDSLFVYRDGTLVDRMEITLDGYPSASPIELLDSDGRLLDRNLFIRIPGEGSYDYTIAVKDEAGNVYSEELTIIFGTSTILYTGSVFFNVEGTGNGALDLDTGLNTSKNSAEAEIRDLGIDDTIDPMAAENWIAAIEPVNGATIAELIPGENGLAETFTFESIEFDSQLEALVDNTGPSLNSTGTVNVGQLFYVQANGNFYMVKIVEINPSFGTNNDSYLVDIKVAN